MELGFGVPYLAAHLGEGGFRERRGALHLYKVWEAARDGHQLPRLTDFDLSLLERIGGDCFLLEFVGNGAPAKFKYFGRGLAAAVKRDLTGYPITAVPQASLLAQLVAQCEGAVQTGKPIALDGLYSAVEGEHLLYRGILLPFANEGEKTECVLGCLRSRHVQARQALAHSIARTRSLLPARLEPVRQAAGASSVAYPEQFKTALLRARQQSALLHLEKAPPTRRVEQLLSVLRTRIRQTIWPDSAVQFARSATAIGKAVLAERHHSEFALLLARRLDAQSNRYEIVSVADAALLNLAMRSACVKSQSTRRVRRETPAEAVNRRASHKPN